jgi:alpha-ketoglutarate-dependent taurine dioxygenase
MESAMQTSVALRARPLKSGFGAEILDVDVTSADPDTLAEVVTAFHRHGAIVLRNQRLDPPQQIAFTALFGEPEDNVRKEYVIEDHPKVYVISNKVVNGRTIGEFAAGIGWHTDLSYSARPALCTILHALEAPPEGSDTLIADLCAAWNALPPDKQRQIDGRRVHHSFVESMRKRGLQITPEQRATMPDVFHPLVRRHACDGRKSLWLSSLISGISGMPEPEAQALMKELLDFATQDRFVYRHKWAAGDVLVWDDRCTLHTGTPFDTEKYVRLVHRTWVRGEIPM